MGLTFRTIEHIIFWGWGGGGGGGFVVVVLEGFTQVLWFPLLLHQLTVSFKEYIILQINVISALSVCPSSKYGHTDLCAVHLHIALLPGEHECWGSSVGPWLDCK